MSLKIIEFKTSKDTYVFWEDKVMEASFRIASDGKGYELNSIEAEYGIRVGNQKNFVFRKIWTFKISDNLSLWEGGFRDFSFTVPISFPNVGGNHPFEMGVKNYIRLTADVKMNPFDCKETIHPSVTVNNPMNDRSPNKTPSGIRTSAEIHGEIVQLLPLEKRELSKGVSDEFAKLFNDLQTGSVRREDFDVKNKELQEKRELLFASADQTTLKKLRSELEESFRKEAEELDNKIDKFKKNELFIRKDDKNYVAIGWMFRIDYVNREFYEYAKANYLLFRVSDVLKNSKALKIIYVFLLIATWAAFFTNGFGYPLPVERPTLWWSLLWLFFLMVPYFGFVGMGLEFVRKRVIKINLKKREEIRKKLLEHSLRLSDVFDTCEIAYGGKYHWDIDVTLGCVLHFTYRSGDKSKTEDIPLFYFLLGSYSGTNLRYDNLEEFPYLERFKNVFVSPEMFSGNFSLVKISYQLKYVFSSPDLINSSGFVKIT